MRGLQMNIKLKFQFGDNEELHFQSFIVEDDEILILFPSRLENCPADAQSVKCYIPNISISLVVMEFPNFSLHPMVGRMAEIPSLTVMKSPGFSINCVSVRRCS